MKKRIIIMILVLLVSSCNIFSTWKEVNEEKTSVEKIDENITIKDETVEEEDINVLEFVEDIEVEDWVVQEKKNNFTINENIWEE